MLNFSQAGRLIAALQHIEIGALDALQQAAVDLDQRPERGRLRLCTSSISGCDCS